MSIKQIVEDSDFLLANDRYEGALMMLLVAVSASSRRLFPEKIRDNQRFKRFLGARINQILTGDPFVPEDGTHTRAQLIAWTGDTRPEDVLYDVYRNSLVHEGNLPPGVVIDPQRDTASAIGMELDGATCRIASGLFTLLRASVVEAPINGKEFGLIHPRLTPRDGRSQDQLLRDLSTEIGESLGTCMTLFTRVQRIGPRITNADAEELRHGYSQYFGGGAFATFCEFRKIGICGIDGKLSDHGIDSIKLLLRYTEFVDIAR